jgi:hypothetical protein
MLKYAKVIDKKTKECQVGLGTNIEAYVAQGMTEQEVEQAYNGSWYLEGHTPEKPQPTYDEIKELRKQYRRKYMDDSTAERSRKQANGSWTAEDEIEYIELDERITQEIEQLYPYPSE